MAAGYRCPGTARVPGDQRLDPGVTVWFEVRGPARAWPA